MSGRILVVDDEPLKRITLQIELTEAGYEVHEAADALAARRLFDSRPVDVVVSDVRMPGMSGLELLAYVKQQRPEVEVILMTAYGTIETAVQAIKRGAFDYITKPFTTRELIEKLRRLPTGREAGPADPAVQTFGRLVARSPSMLRLFARARELADDKRPLLVRGENGTGKDLLSEAVHQHSRRAGGPLLRLSCAASDARLPERELFGQESEAAGAPDSSDAAHVRPGRLELSAGGALVLEAVDSLPPEAQRRLVDFLERGTFERVGGRQPLRADVRLICTTRHDLAARVVQGSFREDLFYRLSVTSLAIPPLRERPDDIPVLARHFLARQAAPDRPPPTICAHALDELMRYAWPGNARELEHVIERALVLCGGSEIRPEHVLPLATERSEALAAPPLELGEGGSPGLTETVADIERRLILLALRQCGGNQARAAQKLGIPRTTLRDKMTRYGIPGS
jgi:two-component system response regulator HydG